MSETIVALYKESDTVHRVVTALTDAGIEREAVSVVARDPEGSHSAALEAHGKRGDDDRRSLTADGAMLGGGIGALAGLLFGLSAFTIPGLGPIIIAGPLYTAILGAGAGSLGGGLIGALVNAGIPHHEATYYREGISRGYTLIAVEVDEEKKSSALHIMKAHNPLNIEEAVEKWRASGWKEPQKTPHQFEPSQEDKSKSHKYPTGSWDQDTADPDFRRRDPPLPTGYDEDTADD